MVKVFFILILLFIGVGYYFNFSSKEQSKVNAKRIISSKEFQASVKEIVQSSKQQPLSDDTKYFQTEAVAENLTESEIEKSENNTPYVNSDEFTDFVRELPLEQRKDFILELSQQIVHDTETLERLRQMEDLDVALVMETRLEIKKRQLEYLQTLEE